MDQPAQETPAAAVTPEGSPDGITTTLTPLILNAIAARDDNNPELGIKLAENAIAQGERSVAPYMIKASCLGDMRRHDEAMVVIEQALKDCPADQHSYALHERGFQRLLKGQYKEGWPDWDFRIQKIQMGENLAKVWPGITEWDGSPNRRVLVCGEKGLGDSILFGRYMSLLQERNCTIQFLAGNASRPLISLLQKYPGIYGAYGGDDTIPQVSEMWISLESLPRFTDTIPPPFAFPVSWKQDPDIRSRRPRIGLCWHGSTGYSASKHRRPEDLKLWEPVTQVKGVDFISLQLGEQGPCKAKLPADSSVLDTVKQACSCDLVISMDTSVVHMTASAGVPTWMPLHYLNYWPWIMTDEESTVWYPSLKIFRQDKNDWTGVFQRLAASLEEFKKGVGAAGPKLVARKRAAR